MIVHAFHELVKLGHELSEVPDPLVDSLKGTEELLQLSPVCGLLYRLQSVHAARAIADAIG